MSLAVNAGVVALVSASVCILALIIRMRSVRASSAESFARASVILRQEGDAFEGRAQQFEARHRPPGLLLSARQALAMLLDRLEDGDPLLLWAHTHADFQSAQALKLLERLAQTLNEVSDEPMAFKTSVQREREAALSQAAHQLALQITILRAEVRRHARAPSDAARGAIFVAAVASLGWGVAVSM